MTANIEKIDAIIAEIKAEKIELDMQVITDQHDCGTSACIMGFYNLLVYSNFNEPDTSDIPDDMLLDDISLMTQHDFGMSREGLRELFYASHSGVRLYDITRDMAIRALEDVKKGEFTTWRDYA